MKTIVLLCLVAAAWAAPPVSSYPNAQVVKSTYEVYPEGGFVWEFAQDDGTSAQAKGEFHPGSGKDGDEGAVVSSGSFTWVGDDGVTYTATYTADENGYHPRYSQGQGGAIPEEIVKAFSKK